MTESGTIIIDVRYRQLGEYHVFTSTELYGLYVANRDPEAAFERVAGSIAVLLKENHGVDVHVEPAWSFSDFCRQNGIEEPDVPHPAFIPAQQFVARRAA